MTYCGQITVKQQRGLWYVDTSQRKKPHIAGISGARSAGLEPATF
jgi:hypothetical protein